MKQATSFLRVTVPIVPEHRHRSLSPLVNYCSDNYTLLEASPRGAHQPLPQLCHVLYWRLLDSFLLHCPNAVIK